MTEKPKRPKYCPICGQENGCGRGERQGSCWCTREYFPKGIFEWVPPDQLRKSCICIDCLKRYVRENPADTNTHSLP
ncbi:cysteine-rich CWC family protein [Kroppenstedtia guangzhouensis]|jgi:Cysteine-rich CWC|uniref:cysteine-rich CWC family protein n=1 Tax=Kroppenstedtia guangzhouensis TaxID=1274356 RepID=UPI001669CD8E|nr:cysteine-rich CWC family protein [Kroppenstedtia guangzhouensis]